MGTGFRNTTSVMDPEYDPIRQRRVMLWEIEDMLATFGEAA